MSEFIKVTNLTNVLTKIAIKLLLKYDLFLLKNILDI